MEDIHTKIFNDPDLKIPIEETPLKERTKRLLINSRKIYNEVTKSTSKVYIG